MMACIRQIAALAIAALALAAATSAQTKQLRVEYKVTYVAADVIYLDAGTTEGLEKGIELELRRLEPGQALIQATPVGTVRVIAATSNSAVCEPAVLETPAQRGDLATLSRADAERVSMLLASKNARHYAQIITFSEFIEGNDPLQDEQRAYVPKPPLAEINRSRGRVSVQQSSLFDHTSGTASHQTGLAIRADITRIGGTYWNFGGNWRGRMSSRGRGIGQETINDLISRTYNIGFTYENPNSRHRIGAGRLILPWASSLSTIDGGYYGYRLKPALTVGAFAGSTPDPTAWNFDPNRQIAGVFSSFETGSFDGVRYTGTVGAAHTRRNWLAERQFAFFQNTIAVKRHLSVYHNAEVDYRSAGRFGSTSGGPVLSRSYLSVRTQVNDVVSFDINHNYFRGTPTFDNRLLGTGLLDRLLFQGVSAGMRIQLPERSAVYVQLGQSDRNSDATSSWNYMLGYTHGQLPWLGLRADIRTSHFSSSFGSGRYHTLTLSRDLADALRLELQVGQQEFVGALTASRRARFVNSRLEWFFSSDYFLGVGVATYRGDVQNYDQILLNLGYRF